MSLVLRKYISLKNSKNPRANIPKFIADELYRLLGEIYFGQRSVDRVVAFWETIDFLDKTGVEITFANLCQDYDCWELLKKGYRVGAEGDSFIDFFWSVRFMHMPIWTLLKARNKVPKARVYHSVSTGYAGIIGAFAARVREAPYFITEDGIYTKERVAEISQAGWIHESESYYFDPHKGLSVLKKMWVNLFTFLGHISYAGAERIITLYEGNTRLQVEYGAQADRLEIIPNGILPTTYDQTREVRKKDDVNLRMIVWWLVLWEGWCRSKM
jgi:polysaccharide biosynthesis protein PelF